MYALILILYIFPYYSYFSSRIVPSAARSYWLRKLRHTKIKFVFSACSSEATNTKRGIYSFSEPEVEPAEQAVDEEEKLLENVQGDYEGPYHVLTPSFTSAKETSVPDESALTKERSVLDEEEYVDIEQLDVSGSNPKVDTGNGPLCGRGIRIVQVSEDDVTQRFYSMSNLPTRAKLNWS